MDMQVYKYFISAGYAALQIQDKKSNNNRQTNQQYITQNNQ